MDSKSGSDWIVAWPAAGPDWETRQRAVRLAADSMMRWDDQELIERAAAFYEFLNGEGPRYTALSLAMPKNGTNAAKETFLVRAGLILAFLQEEDAPQAAREAA